MEPSLENFTLPEKSIAVKRENGYLHFEVSHHESRGWALESLLQTAASEGVGDFDWILFSLADKPLSLDRNLELQESIPYYQPCTSDFTDYSKTYPDYFFQSCTNYGIDDYEHYRIKLMAVGFKNPTTQALGWLGALTSDVRRKFVEHAKTVGKDNIFYRSIEWNSEFNSVPAYKYMSMLEQSSLFKYLIDMEGVGYTPRLKLQFFSFRPIFIVDRPWKEFFFEHLVPWVHYVPVKRDLSDLSENINRLDEDDKLYKYIRNNMSQFAQDYLTRAAAVKRLRAILLSHTR